MDSVTRPNTSAKSRAEATCRRVEDAVREPLLELGLDVEAVELTLAGKRRVLRVAVDADGGPTLDDVADATRGISAVLDDSDVMGEMPYTLEVTSRGVDRPLTLPRHWRRNADRLVAITLQDGTEIVGRITATDDDGAEIEVADDQQRISYSEVARALIQIEFNRPRTAVKHEESDL